MITFLEKKRSISIILMLLITIEIFYFSSITTESITTKNPLISTTYHFSVFFLFSFFLLASIKGIKKLRLNYLLIALIVSIAYAILDEIHQMFVPLRDATLTDFLINTIGIFVSTIVYMYKENRIKKLDKF